VAILNYLAHLYLADADPESQLGSLMGDFVKGRVDESLHSDLRWGVILHRKVDTFTDAHPVVRRSKERIDPGLRRYAGILIDIFYDHFLAVGWREYSDEALDSFSSGIYRLVRSRHGELPARMQRSMRYMVENRLLESYRKIDGVSRALAGIDTRLKRPAGLTRSVDDLERNYNALRGDFSEFFPLLIDHVSGLNAER
jgi:acyl carrier protein phosphodiesterase